MVGVAEMTVKGRRCLVIDSGNRDLRIKLHWVLHNVPDEEVKVAFAPFGRVTQVTKEKWRVDGCSKQSTMTRVAVLKLNVGVKPDDIPHQLRIDGDLALVVVRGRLPNCLWFQRDGHVRRECRVPRCNTCRRFGHEPADCVKMCGPAATNVVKEDGSDMIMHEEDSEEGAGANSKSAEAENRVELPPDKGGEGGNPGRVESPSRLHQSTGEGTSIKESTRIADVTVPTATPTLEGAASDEEMANAASGVRKHSSSESHSQWENLQPRSKQRHSEGQHSSRSRRFRLNAFRSRRKLDSAVRRGCPKDVSCVAGQLARTGRPRKLFIHSWSVSE
ncbi:hypothetical protein HPB48_019556 [Haemaphysalis longicornis]|uniref:Uncharacterized protein n=1 Tax=Haemaphysalis longicornis TaxID=44386 RepID=A0A9J6FRY0_HAELO|nr:hypothetical protein HPB48_019556 [Haemaphysalis longicornis]